MLLACGRAAIRTKDWRPEDVDLAFEVHWPEFVNQARRHGLMPIVYRYLEVNGACPKEIRRWLHDEAVGAVAGNFQQISALRAAAACFERSGIPWLCVKGPVTAATLYDEPALRSFSDIDLVIRLPDFEAAYASLIEAGYRPKFDISPQLQQLLFRTQATQLVGELGSEKIDLHWQLLPMKYSFALAMNEVWARAEPTNTLGICVNTLGRYDTLLFLCLHAAKHDWWRLNWLVDIAALITRSDRLDWDGLANDLEHTSRSTPLRVSLMLVETLVGVDLPARISNLLSDDSTAVALCNERIMRWRREPQVSISPWPWHSLYYRSMSLSADRRHYWHDVLLRPTPLEWKAVPLPFSCRGAYYAVRPLRLMWKHCVRKKD